MLKIILIVLTLSVTDILLVGCNRQVAVPTNQVSISSPNIVTSNPTLTPTQRPTPSVMSEPTTTSIPSPVQSPLIMPTRPQPVPSVKQTNMEEVWINKIINDNRVLITRSNGEGWILEKGIGLLSLGLYEGRQVLIYSPGLFAGIGSKIILPERDQECQIWNSEFLSLSPTIIQSSINGEFKGWEGETIFPLLNGQIWQQATYSYKYHYAYMPSVIIYSISSRYRMEVEGMDGSVYVKRLR